MDLKSSETAKEGSSCVDSTVVEPLLGNLPGRAQVIPSLLISQFPFTPVKIGSDDFREWNLSTHGNMLLQSLRE